MDASALIQPDDEADPLLQREREDVVRDLKARLGGVPVDGGEIFKEVVAGGLAAPGRRR